MYMYSASQKHPFLYGGITETRAVIHIPQGCFQLKSTHYNRKTNSFAQNYRYAAGTLHLLDQQVSRLACKQSCSMFTIL